MNYSHFKMTAMDSLLRFDNRQVQKKQGSYLLVSAERKL